MRERTKRVKRKPFGGLQLKMDIDPETKRRLEAENKVAIWMKDEGGKIQDALNSDYVHCKAETVGGEDQTDATISMRTGTMKHGEPEICYLMEIPREYYEQDQAYIEEQNLAVDHAIRGGETAGQLNVDPNLGETSVKKVDYKP